MPTPEKSTLEASKQTTNPNDQIQAAIDPYGAVKTVELPAEPGTVLEKLETAIDPNGAVGKADLF
jgi:hypothetical protein